MSILFWIWQLVWGLPQTLLGALVFACCRISGNSLPAKKATRVNGLIPAISSSRIGEPSIAGNSSGVRKPSMADNSSDADDPHFTDNASRIGKPSFATSPTHVLEPSTAVDPSHVRKLSIAVNPSHAEALPRRFHGAVITYWPLRGSMSLGPFLFLDPCDSNQEFLRLHEYGHSIQSLMLGPLFLLVIGLPSLTWANLPACRAIWQNRDSGRSYYDFFPERWANQLAERFLQD